MNAAVVVFPAKGTGAGDQVVTGIVDPRVGEAFVGVGAFFLGNATLNTIEAYSRLSYGLDDGSTRRGQAFDEVWQFNGKIVSSGSGNVSLLDEAGSVFFGGSIERQAYVSAFALGAMTLTYTKNTRTGDSICALVFGGADLHAEIAINPTGRTYALGWAPAALLTQEQANGSTPATSGGGGGGIGWATRDGGYGAGSIAVLPQGGNARYLAGAEAGAPLSQTFLGLLSDRLLIDAWSDTGFTVDAGYSSTMAMMAFGGTGIAARQGVELLNAENGAQVVQAGIKPRAIVLMSVGAVANDAVDTSIGVLAIGVSDTVNNGGVFTAEDVVGNSALHGVRRLSDALTLSFPNAPNAGSTTIAAHVYVSGASDTAGTFTLQVVTDGVRRSLRWLVIGEDLDEVVDAPCITAPPAVSCWNGGAAGPIGCATGQTTPQRAGTWGGTFAVDDLTISLNGEGQP